MCRSDNGSFAAGYRLREAELMFQDGQADKSDRMMRGVVRKNPNYAGSLSEALNTA